MKKEVIGDTNALELTEIEADTIMKLLKGRPQQFAENHKHLTKYKEEQKKWRENNGN